MTTITKLSPHRTRAAGNRQAGASNARYAGDPYAIPLHYLRPNAESRGATRTQAKFTYRFNPKPMRGSGASPFHASGGSQFQASGGSHAPQKPDTIAGPYTPHRPILNQDSKEGTFADFGHAIVAGGDAAKGHLLSGSLAIPSNISKASGPSSRQQRRLKPIEGTDKDKGLQAKALQQVRGTFSGANELSMSPSSRHSRRIHLNQSIDQCYFNPELSQMIMNSAAAIVGNASHGTEEDVEAKKKQQQSQMTASRDGRGPAAQRGPLAADGRATILQGRQDLPEHLRLQQHQQQISLYFNHVYSQRSRTSQQNSRRNMIRPADGRGGVEGVSSGFVNSS